MLTRPLSSLFLSCSQSYLQAASDGPASHGLDPSANYNSPKFRSRNQSYMRAVSTLSQASCVSQVGPPPGQPPAAESQPGVLLCHHCTRELRGHDGAFVTSRSHSQPL